jgi:hypothetical protein
VWKFKQVNREFWKDENNARAFLMDLKNSYNWTGIVIAF